MTHHQDVGIDAMGNNTALGTEVAALQALLQSQTLCDEELLASALEAAKYALALRFEATRDPRWLIVRCHVVEQSVSRLICSTANNNKSASSASQSPTDSKSPDINAVRYQKCVFLLENVIASSLAFLQQQQQCGAACVPHSSVDASTSVLTSDSVIYSERQQSDGVADSAVLVSYSFRRLFSSLMSALGAAGDDEPKRVAASVLSRVALLLAVSWLQLDRRDSLPRASEMLAAAAESCSLQRETAASAKAPLLLLGVVTLAERRDTAQALQHLRHAAQCTNTGSNSGASSREDGVVHFWLGVALLQSGLMHEAVERFEQCLRCDYEPVASLNLSALAHLSDNSSSNRGDAHAASLDLQRALELDVLATASMFNYAALLGSLQNFNAQQQMLEFCLDAVVLERAANENIERKRLAAVLAPHVTHVTHEMVVTQLAYAAMENGDWQQAKQSFEQLLVLDSAANTRVDVQCDFIFVLLQNSLHTLALETCERTLASSSADTLDDTPAWLLIHLYKADALLSLERVRECAQFLTDVVKPKIQGALQRQEHSTNTSNTSADEVVACHMQLINNFAVATACREPDGVDAAVAMLRDGVQQYSGVVSLRFNLVLLLWRKEQKEAACAIWFETRGWSLRMDASNVGDDSKAIEMVAAAEDAAIAAAVSPYPQVSDHVRSGDSNADESSGGGVSAQQLLYLDALVLNYWGKIQSSCAIQTSVLFVEHFDALARDQQQQHE